MTELTLESARAYVDIHGLDKSKDIVANAPSDDHFYSWSLGESGVKDKTVHIGTLRKAIDMCLTADNEQLEKLAARIFKSAVADLEDCQ